MADSTHARYQVPVLKSLVKIDWRDTPRRHEFLTISREHLRAHVTRALSDEARREVEFRAIDAALSDLEHRTHAADYDPANHLAALTATPAIQPAPVLARDEVRGAPVLARDEVRGAPEPAHAEHVEKHARHVEKPVEHTPPEHARHESFPTASEGPARGGFGTVALAAAAFAGLLGGAAAGLATGALVSGGAGCPSVTCFVSDWQPVDSTATRTLRVGHGLGATPREIILQFSTDRAGTLVRVVTPGLAPAVNPVGLAADATTVLIDLRAGVPLPGAFDATTGARQNLDRGFVRVVARR